MKILMIDDIPGRIGILRNSGLIGHDIYIALGFSQIDYYMQYNYDFDLVLLDHDMMDHMNGFEVCQQFLINKTIPVIIISTNEPASNRMLSLLEEYEVECFYRPIIRPLEIVAEINRIEMRYRQFKHSQRMRKV